MNRFLNVVVRESPLDSPFMPKAKCEALDASALGGLLTFASSLFNNATNVGLTTATNAANERMNALNIKLGLKNMQQQKDLFNQSLAYQTDMWNKQNAYNSPSAQVARLRAAGINPAAMFGESTPASSVSSPSVPSTHAPQATFAMQSPQVDFNGVGSAVFQALAMKNQMAKTDSEINYTNAKAEFEWQSMFNRLLEQANKAKYGSIEWQQAQEQLKLFRETYDSQRQAIENNAAVTGKQAEKLTLDIAAQQIENRILSIDAKWKESLNQANWQAIKIGIREAASRIQNNQRDSALKSAQIAVERAKHDGLQIDNEQKDALVDIIVDEAESKLTGTQRQLQEGKVATQLPYSRWDIHSQRNSDRHREQMNYRRSKRKSYLDRL